MIETWRDIPGFEGYYQASSKGRIKSLERLVKFSNGRVYKYKSEIKKLTKNNGGYLFTSLSKGDLRRAYCVHRLVAMTFLGNDRNDLVVNHKDRDRSNNCVENLEWCTVSENVRYTFKCGYKISDETKLKMSKSRTGKKLSEEHIKNSAIGHTGGVMPNCIKILDISTGISYLSLRDYAKANNLNYHTVKGRWRRGVLHNVKNIAKQPAA